MNCGFLRLHEDRIILVRQTNSGDFHRASPPRCILQRPEFPNPQPLENLMSPTNCIEFESAQLGFNAKDHILRREERRRDAASAARHEDILRESRTQNEAMLIESRQQHDALLAASSNQHKETLRANWYNTVWGTLAGAFIGTLIASLIGTWIAISIK